MVLQEIIDGDWRNIAMDIMELNGLIYLIVENHSKFYDVVKLDGLNGSIKRMKQIFSTHRKPSFLLGPCITKI